MAATSLTLQTFLTDTPQKLLSETLVADMVFTASGSGNIALVIVNGAATSITCTLVGTGYCTWGFQHSLVQAIPAGETWVFPPITTARFQDSATQTVEITSTGTTLTGCTIKALKLK